MRARLVRALVWLFSKLPLGAAHGIGTLIGNLLYYLPNSLRRISRINLDLGLPELDRGERRRLLRTSLIETAKTALETGALWSVSQSRARQLIVEVEGREAVDQALAEGRGVIVATPHLGSWEMAGHFGGMQWQMTHLYRPPRMPELESLLREGRSHLGAGSVRTDREGVRRLFEILRQGGVVGMLPDQDPGQGNGVFAPFFGVPANTMVLLPRLARKTAAAVFFGYCERLPRARGYRVRIFPAPAAITDPDPLVAATAMNQAVEACVRRLPEQYQWGYRRFRNRPPGEERIY